MEPRAQFEELYRAYADRVHAYALRRTAPSAADDVVAEVFLIAWRRLDQVPDEPLGWLLGVARRVLANRRRSDSRAAGLRERLARESSAAAPVPTPEPMPEAGDRDDRVRRALAGLNERDRELLLLIAWEGLRVHEAAQVLGVRSNTLAVRLHRARQRLADALAAQDIETEMEVRR
ncbi:MAG TPA: sigma-70 family RNA polymerase sigma factor [Solirubrobacteraceae bacterium]|nr:sigma-70 family RNA polymerase sigma factor [Solirubrobacteraceae bacterium]